MDCTATNLSFEQTGYFSGIIIDYLNQADALRPFYMHPVSLDGIKASILSRQQFTTNRAILAGGLKRQYQHTEASAAVSGNIDKLSSSNTFTITTAHQPAIFTGTLYFVYKILHAIKLAAWLSDELPQYQFVPVFYMGSEDADLEELGNIYLDNEKMEWDTPQTGAVGRMNTKGLEKIIARIEGEYSVEPYGKELTGLLKEFYLNSPDIQTATFRLVNHLFGEYGLLVLIPDNPNLKREMIRVFEDDLFHQKPSAMVAETIEALSKHYKVQANPRDINLFYLEDGLRGRIEKGKDKFVIHSSDLAFTKEEIKAELEQHPERFSPNVILRGLFQETILPNIAFIGGGGEMAYWLELKNLFAHYNVPFPVLVLRNSFLIIKKKWKQKLDNTGLTIADIFRDEEELMNELVRKESQQQLSLGKEIAEAAAYYQSLEKTATQVDPTLAQHVEALQAKALKPLKNLEKKLLKAEKRKFGERRAQIHAVKSVLFPANSLQERIDNFIPYYATLGKKFIELLYENSHTLEQDFVVLSDI